MPKPFKVEGSLVQGGTRLRWKPVPRAKTYAIEWLDKGGQWLTLWSLEGDETAPNRDGFVEYIDEFPGPVASGDTYRIAAYFRPNLEGKPVTSLPVALTSKRPARTTRDDLLRRLGRKELSARVKALIARLKWRQHGWTLLLPKETGQVLGKRIEVEVRSPQLTDQVIDLLAVIFENLPKLAAKAEKAFNDHGGSAALDEEDRIDRPRVVIDESPRERKSAGAWAMVIEVKGSDYGWHIEFVRTRFKEIWAGD